jgi:hypothetical protein
MTIRPQFVSSSINFGNRFNTLLGTATFFELCELKDESSQLTSTSLLAYLALCSALEVGIRKIEKRMASDVIDSDFRIKLLPFNSSGWF